MKGPPSGATASGTPATHTSQVASWLDSKRPWQLLTLALAVALVYNPVRGLLAPARPPAGGGNDAPGAPEAPPGRGETFPSMTSQAAKQQKVEVPALGRLLAGSEAGSGSSADHHESHPQEALFFLFNAIVFGTIILHLTMMPRLRGLQQTVVLFVLGMTYSLLQDGLGLTEHLGIVGRSYNMWMAIDPHLLAFAMLPVLLAGDAMTIDTNIARTVAKQCIFLAGPGVLISAFLTALFLWVYLPYDWSFLLCLVTGSILAATDPVAVVGLLKELGASPTLTVQIQGESLLNDGTAIVLWSVAYAMVGGAEYDSGEIIIYLVKTALCAAGLGVIIGWIFFIWIKHSSNRLEHSSSMTQSALTLCCAYWSFIISEGVLHISGVLCTVGASLVLADRMWPVLVDKESLHHVWHMFEYLGNTLIFFLAGALTGKSMTEIPLEDYLHLFVIYIVATLIRGMLFFTSRPILTYLSEDASSVSAADAAIMTWGGLRGAVGLVLAMQVSRDKAGGHISGLDGDRVLFYVGGIATLTLVINATTCPALVRVLGITSTPAAKQRLLMNIYEQLSRLGHDERHPHQVKDTLHTVLHDAKHHIEDLVHDKDSKPFWAKAVSGLSAKFATTHTPAPGSYIVTVFDMAKREYDLEVDNQLLEVLDLPNVHWSDEMAKAVKDCVTQKEPDGHMLQAINEALLSLVRAQYWHQIDVGEFTAGTSDAEMLLSSVSYAFNFANRRLADFGFLKCYLKLVHEEETVVDRRNLSQQVQLYEFGPGGPPGQQRGSGQEPEEGGAGQEDLTAVVPVGTSQRLHKIRRRLQTVVAAPKSRLATFLEDSLCFNMSIAVTIVLNAIFIGFEQGLRDASNQKHPAWFVLEIFFNSIFSAEFLIKVAVFRCAYFFSGWNLFDVTLVVVGLFGIGIEVVSMTSTTNSGDMSSEARLLRVNRVFRVLRIIRIFRLAKFIKILRARLKKKDINLELAEQLQTITVLRAFVRAHAKSQAKLMEYIGDDGNLRSCEEARCILESQTQIYRAIASAASEAKQVDKSQLQGMKLLRANIVATGELTEFVLGANRAGVINAREAECILHPLEDHMRVFYKRLQDSHEGFAAEEDTPDPHRHHEKAQDQHLMPPPVMEQSSSTMKKSTEAWCLPGCAPAEGAEREALGGSEAEA